FPPRGDAAGVISRGRLKGDSIPGAYFGRRGRMVKPDPRRRGRNKGRAPFRGAALGVPGRKNLAVLLNARGPEAGQSVLVDRLLPAEEFLVGQTIALARLVQRQQPAAHGGD